jgi:hypothetical protein
VVCGANIAALEGLIESERLIRPYVFPIAIPSMHMSSPVTMVAHRDVIRAWFALCILRIVVKLAVIKDIPAISLLGFVLQFSFFRERNLPLGSEMPNERCHPGRILEASLACFIASRV